MLNCRIDNENTTRPRSDSLACARPQNMKMEAYRCILLGPPFPSMGKGQDRGAKEPIKSNHPYLYPSPSRGRSWRAGGLLYKSAINPAPTPIFKGAHEGHEGFIQFILLSFALRVLLRGETLFLLWLRLCRVGIQAGPFASLSHVAYGPKGQSTKGRCTKGQCTKVQYTGSPTL
jgi:hypothetical protein